MSVLSGSEVSKHERDSVVFLFPLALGLALAAAGRPLVYGGGSKGIMGVVSASALEGGGKVIGVIPRVMLAQDGEGEKVDGVKVHVNEVDREKVISNSHIRMNSLT